jgi:hypothetical protein
MGLHARTVLSRHCLLLCSLGQLLSGIYDNQHTLVTCTNDPHDPRVCRVEN